MGQYTGPDQLFTSSADLVDNLVNIKKTKHYLQIKYLASRHQAAILELRFVLQPFSFLFLLQGETNYYLVWETLDTEDATYLCKICRSRAALQTGLAEIESIPPGIKKSGRQLFLENAPPNFSRIVHDYGEVKKGFVVWKGALEKQMV